MSTVHIKFLNQTIKRDGYDFPYEKDTTISQLKKRIIVAQMEWRKKLLPRQQSQVVPPSFEILNLYYINVWAKESNGKVAPDDESLVSELPKTHIFVKMLIPLEWKFIGERNRDTRRRKDPTCLTSCTSNQKKVKQGPSELGRTIEKRESVASSYEWLNLLLLKLAEIDYKLDKLIDTEPKLKVFESAVKQE
jgi:hypothetical protein